MPGSQPLAIPEILSAVFKTLQHERSTLAIAARVSKLWFEYATDVLWRHHGFEHLGGDKGVAVDRQQIYASKIESIDYPHEPDGMEPHYYFSNLSFDRLKNATLYCYMDEVEYNEDEDFELDIQQYLRPTLKTLRLFGKGLDSHVLSLIKSQCPFIDDILFDTPNSTLTPDALFDFICGFRSLKKITLTTNMGPLTTDKLLLHLAGRPDLVKLHIEQAPSPVFFSELPQHISARPFPVLRNLGLLGSVPSATAALLADMLPGLETVNIRLEDCEHSIFESLSRMENLSQLYLSFDFRVVVTSEQLMLLKSLHKLEVLSLAAWDGWAWDGITATSSEPRFGDTEFDQLMAGFPALKSLRFRVKCEISPAWLASLSARCRMLEKIEILYTFERHEFMQITDEESPMFPHLTKLHFKGFLETPGHAVDEYTLSVRLKKQFPKLALFLAGSSVVLTPRYSDFSYR